MWRYRPLQWELLLQQCQRDHRDAEGDRQQCARLCLQARHRFCFAGDRQGDGRVQPEGAAPQSDEHLELRDGAGAGRRNLAADGDHARDDLRSRRQRSEEHTSELQSLMRISYAVFCLKKKQKERSTTESAKKTTEKMPIDTQTTR